MTSSNSEIEQNWIDLWNTLSDLADSIKGQKRYLIDWKSASEDELKGWLQDSVYERKRPVLEKVWYNGAEAIRGHLPVET